MQILKSIQNVPKLTKKMFKNDKILILFAPKALVW